MSEPEYDKERPEGEEEKEEKQEKHEEKDWDEKWHRDPSNALVWALILVWAGVVLLLGNLGFFRPFAFLDAWSLIFFGAGLILLLEAGVRVLLPAYRRGVTGRVILAFVFLGIGLAGMIGWHLVWPLVLIGLGVIIILGTLIWWRR